jgi:Tfp pilus assembly protein PilN
MRAVNLLPSEKKTEAGGLSASSAGGGALTTTRVAIVGGSLAAVIVGFVGFTFVGARGDVADKRDSLAAIERQVDEARTAAAAQIQQHQQQVVATTLSSDVKAQLDTFNVASSQRIQWDLLLSDVSRAIPAGSWLSSLTLQGTSAEAAAAAAAAPQQTTTPPVQATPTGFVASGFALSQERVVRLLQQLALVPMLSDITLQRSESTTVGTGKAFQFTLSANVRLDRVS